MRRSNTRRRMGTFALLFGLLVLTLGVLAGPAQAKPKDPGPDGKNGTVKIHDLGDPVDHPDNDPHVVCPFQIDFYNFDLGQHLNALLTAQPPSGSGQTVWSGDITADNVPAPPGAGNDYDGTLPVLTLDLTGLFVHPIQGVHLKLTVTDDSANELTKHKVFWVTPCGQQENPTTTTTTIDDGTTTTTEEVTTTTAEETTTTVKHDIVLPTTTTTEEVLGNDLVATTTTVTVLGEVIARTAPPAVAAELPRTGTSTIEWGVPLGVALILLGLVLLSYENVLKAAKS